MSVHVRSLLSHLVGDTLNCSQECYPVRGKNGRKKTMRDGRRERGGGVESKREREDKRINQCGRFVSLYTVHHAKLMERGQRERSWELMS